MRCRVRQSVSASTTDSSTRRTPSHPTVENDALGVERHERGAAHPRRVKTAHPHRGMVTRRAIRIVRRSKRPAESVQCAVTRGDRSTAENAVGRRTRGANHELPQIAPGPVDGVTGQARTPVAQRSALALLCALLVLDFADRQVVVAIFPFLRIEFGATEIVTERGDKGVARIKDLTGGIGADSVLECVGTEESMMQAIRSTRPGGSIGYVGVPHGAALDVQNLFFALVRLHGGPAPVRRYLPNLIKLVWDRKINPGKVFDLVLPIEQVADGYRAMDERRAIKALLRP